MLANALLATFLQVTLLAGLPLFLYGLYHRLRFQRHFPEVARRIGLQRGNPRYLLYALAGAAVVIVTLLLWSPRLQALTRPGSAQHQFVGLGLTSNAIALALLYGVLQTGFVEELLFRGLIAGMLSRRLPFTWATLVQALIFLAPHFLILRIAPEVWPILPLVFLGALLFGWLRIQSGSILPSWLIHATGNVTVALLVAAHT